MRTPVYCLVWPAVVVHHMIIEPIVVVAVAVSSRTVQSNALALVVVALVVSSRTVQSNGLVVVVMDLVVGLVVESTN